MDVASTPAERLLSLLSSEERADVGARFDAWQAQLGEIGRDPDGGWTRLSWTPEDLRARAWFQARGRELGFHLEVDRNGNQWLWTRPPERPGLVTGSHLDTVRNGGAFDGALGVVGGLLAAHVLARRGVTEPVGVVNFVDEEGGRFGVPMLGSRLATGALTPSDVVERADGDGVTLREALVAAWRDPDALGRDPQTLSRIAAYVELHVEQGRALEDLGQPVAVADRILPHGRWRVRLTGRADHGGTTPLARRRDPTVALAELILAGRAAAAERGALVTVGRVLVSPNSSNSVPGRVTAWLDVRSQREDDLPEIAAEVERRVLGVAEREGVEVSVTRESQVAAVEFSPALRARLLRGLPPGAVAARELSTAAGHDAAALAPHVPVAMLFVRNPTGVSHSPDEHARREDCLAGVAALVGALELLAEEAGT